MMTGTDPREGVEYTGGADERDRDERGWPILSATGPRAPVSASEPCDGTNPLTGHPCRLGYHQGYHRDTAGDWWLDD